MGKIKRFSISIKENLLREFDSYLQRRKYPTRSKAIEDLIRNELKKDVFERGKKGAGALIVVYDHHKRELTAKLTGIQHGFSSIIICSQHVHLDHRNCMEIIVLKGTREDMQELKDKLKTQKGVKFASLNLAAPD